MIVMMIWTICGNILHSIFAILTTCLPLHKGLPLLCNFRELRSDRSTHCRITRPSSQTGGNDPQYCNQICNLLPGTRVHTENMLIGMLLLTRVFHHHNITCMRSRIGCRYLSPKRLGLYNNPKKSEAPLDIAHTHKMSINPPDHMQY